jgi:hypothetical protein
MNSTRAKVLVLSVFAAAGFLPAACGGGSASAPPAASAPSEPSATSALDTTKTPPAAAAADSAAASSAPSGAAPADTAPTPLGQVLLTDSAQIQKIFDAAKAAPTATLKNGGPTGSDPLAKGIRDVAMKLPAGMKPDGPLATGSLKEKQHLQTDLTLQPGKCYSIVGFSKKVKDLDLYLFVPPGILSGQDLSDDNKPVVGGPPQPMCPIGNSAITYKLDIFADSGSGDVAVQLFSKGN